MAVTSLGTSQSGNFTLTWNATDPVDSPLLITVQYGITNLGPWTTIVTGNSYNDEEDFQSYVWATSGVIVNGPYYIRVIAEDDTTSGSVVSGTLTVINNQGTGYGGGATAGGTSGGGSSSGRGSSGG